MRVIRIVIGITVPIFLIMLFASLLTTTPYLMISKGLYDSHDEIDFDHDYAADRIMGYLNYRYDDLICDEDATDNCYYMRDTEISHMVDVKNLYTMLRLVALGSLIVGVSLSIYVYKKDKEELYKAYKYIYVGPALFVLVLGGYIIVDFNAAFTAFHQLFFTNDDWILYSTDVLIRLLPSNFWMVSGLIILVLFSLSLGLIYYLNERFHKKNSLN